MTRKKTSWFFPTLELELTLCGFQTNVHQLSSSINSTEVQYVSGSTKLHSITVIHYIGLNTFLYLSALAVIYISLVFEQKTWTVSQLMTTSQSWQMGTNCFIERYTFLMNYTQIHSVALDDVEPYLTGFIWKYSVCVLNEHYNFHCCSKNGLVSDWWKV